MSREVEVIVKLGSSPPSQKVCDSHDCPGLSLSKCCYLPTFVSTPLAMSPFAISGGKGGGNKSTGYEGPTPLP